MMELSQRFTFEVPHAKYTPAFKERMWDGKIRLLNLGTGKLYYGLHDYVREFAEKEGYECIYDDSIDSEGEFSVVEAQKMFKALDLSASVGGERKDITVHDYQERAIIHAIQSRRSLLQSPTASGKSLMIYVLCRYLLAKTKSKILIVVPTTSLVEQLYGDFADYSAKVVWDVENNCHRIYQGKEKDSGSKRIVISTWQSIYKMPPQWFEQFGSLFGDEVHLFSAKELTGLATKCTNAGYRVGTTGTVQDAKTNVMVLEGLFGRVYQTTTTRKLMDAGTVAQLTIKCLCLKYPLEDAKKVRKLTYQEEIEFLIGHPGRNRFIRNLALSLNGNTLVLYQFVEKHGKPLHAMIQAKAEAGRKVYFVAGKTATEEREAIRKIVESETNAIIVASYGTFSTGINIRNLDNVIFASPTKSKIRVLQSIGRGLRTSDRKTKVALFDIVDDLSYTTKQGNTHTNYSLLHFTERQSYYAAEKFPYKMYKIVLEVSHG